MYVARLREFVVKRMPNAGNQHHPRCSSFEPDDGQSGLGSSSASAIRELESGRTELRVDFPWSKRRGNGAVRGAATDAGQVETTARRLSLRAVMHFLFERAGFNRCVPAIAGRRNWGVVHKYLTEATQNIDVAGGPLAGRLFVPEAFDEGTKAEPARRRRERLAMLKPHDGSMPLALVIGEFKAVEAVEEGRRVWIRHMPDAPLPRRGQASEGRHIISWDELGGVRVVGLNRSSARLQVDAELRAMLVPRCRQHSRPTNCRRHSS